MIAEKFNESKQIIAKEVKRQIHRHQTFQVQKSEAQKELRSFKHMLHPRAAHSFSERSSSDAREYPLDTKQSFSKATSKPAAAVDKQMQKVLKLHNQAKEIIQTSKAPEVPKRIEEYVPPLNKRAVQAKAEEMVPLRLPVYVPESVYRRKNNLPPLAVNRTTKNGETMTVYVLGDPSPAFDPLVKVETLIERPIFERDNDSVVARAHTREDFSNQSEEVNVLGNLKKKKKSNFKNIDVEERTQLSPVPKTKNIRIVTPKAKGISYCFREIEKPEHSINLKRKWVSDRIKLYSEERVRADFTPKVCPNKRLEMTLRKLREKSARTPTIRRVKLDSF